MNQAPTVLVMWTGAIWSGRVLLVPRPTLFPSGSQGSKGWVALNDWPERNWVMPETSHPPATFPTKPAWSVKKGKS